MSLNSSTMGHITAIKTPVAAMLKDKITKTLNLTLSNIRLWLRDEANWKWTAVGRGASLPHVTCCRSYEWVR
jgi:hypothetical protein